MLPYECFCLSSPLPKQPPCTSSLCACAPRSVRLCSLLRAREGELHALAQALLAQETLTQAEIRSLLENLAAAGGGSPGLAPIGTDGGVVKRPEPLGPMGEGAAEGAAQQPSPVAAAASMQMAGGPAVPAATKR